MRCISGRYVRVYPTSPSLIHRVKVNGFEPLSLRPKRSVIPDFTIP